MTTFVRYFFPRNHDLPPQQDYDQSIRPLTELPYPIFAGEVHENGNLIGWRVTDFPTLHDNYEELQRAHRILKAKNSAKATEIVALHEQAKFARAEIHELSEKLRERDRQNEALQKELARVKRAIPVAARPPFLASYHAAMRLRERFGLGTLQIFELQQLLASSLQRAGQLVYEAVDKHTQLWSVIIKGRTVWCFVAPGPNRHEVKTVYTSELIFGGRFHGPEKRAL